MAASFNPSTPPGISQCSTGGDVRPIPYYVVGGVYSRVMRSYTEPANL